MLIGKRRVRKGCPTGPGFTVAHGSAMGNQDDLRLLYDAGKEKTKQNKKKNKKKNPERKKRKKTVVMLKNTIHTTTHNHTHTHTYTLQVPAETLQ